MGRNKKAFKIKTEYYFHCKNETAKARKEYKDFVKNSRKILKYENQLDCDRNDQLDCDKNDQLDCDKNDQLVEAYKDIKYL